MNSDVNILLEFLDAQRAKQAPHFPTVKFDKVLSFMGTTSLPGTHASVAILPVKRLVAGATALLASFTLSFSLTARKRLKLAITRSPARRLRT